MGIDYEAVICPKCGKKHFRVKDTSNDPVLSLFTSPWEPIYKDGILQNPQKLNKTVSEKFECLECGCNFRVESVPGSAYKFIDEDKEWADRQKIIEKEYRKFEREKKRAERAKKAKAGSDSKNIDINNTLYALVGDSVATLADSSFNTSSITTLGNGEKSTIDLGGLLLKSNKTFTEEQIKNIKEQFGFEVTNNG